MKRSLLVILWSVMSLATQASLPVLTQEPIVDTPPAGETERGGIIPGLRQGAIPQGLAYHEDSACMLMTHYFSGNIPSCISILDRTTAELIGVKWLQNTDGKALAGHAGGIAVSRDQVWVSSDSALHRYRLSDVLKAQPAGIKAFREVPVETRASYCAYHDGMIYVGEFAHYPVPIIRLSNYPTDTSHHLKDRHGRRKYAWICAYDPAGDMQTPVRILSVRQKVQGLAITDEYIFLSISYGRKSGSSLAIYRNPFGEKAHRQVKTKSGSMAPLWFLDETSWLKTIPLPPMAEGIAIIDGKLAILYESGAAKYRDDTPTPTDRIQYYDYMPWLESAETP